MTNKTTSALKLVGYLALIGGVPIVMLWWPVIERIAK